MTATATVDRGTAVKASTTDGRLGSLAGLAFAFCLFVGVAMLDIPKGASDQDLVAWWAESGHQWGVLVSSYMFVLAGLSFLVFLVQLRSRLLAAEGGTGQLASLVLASGAVFVALLFTAAASRGVIAYAVKSSLGEPLPGADTLRYTPLVSYTALGAGGLLAAAVLMVTTSWLIVRTAVFARWVALLGVVAALAVVVANAVLAGPLAIPALLVWTLATSAAMWKNGAPTSSWRVTAVRAGRRQE